MSLPGPQSAGERVPLIGGMSSPSVSQLLGEVMTFAPACGFGLVHGGVGAVEAALIGGLAAFGIPAAVSVPSVLLYRVLTCWLPVFVGWPVMQWLTRNDMV